LFQRGLDFTLTSLGFPLMEDFPLLFKLLRSRRFVVGTGVVPRVCIVSPVEPIPCGGHISVGPRVPPRPARNSGAFREWPHKQILPGTLSQIHEDDDCQGGRQTKPKGNVFSFIPLFFIQNHLSPRFKRWYLRSKRWYLRNWVSAAGVSYGSLRCLRSSPPAWLSSLTAHRKVNIRAPLHQGFYRCHLFVRVVLTRETFFLIGRKRIQL
jgi:hypothetical protein